MRRYSSASVAQMTTTPGDEADEERAGRTDPVARARDRHQAGQEAVRGQAEVPLADARVGVEERRQAGRARGQRGVERHAADALRVERRQRAAGIEAVPAEPQNQPAHGAQDDVVRQRRAAAVAPEDAAEARTERNRADERNRAADAVHDRRAREVAERRRRHRRQPAVRAPAPVADDRVDEAGDADAVENVADEAAAADHRARRDRRAGVGEGELEDPEREQRHAGRAVGVGQPLRKKPVVPMKPLPGSNMNAKPQAQNVMPQMQVSTMPSTRMLIDSRERAKPASSITNPTCMPKTRNAAMSVHIVLIALISGVGPPGACA